MNQMVNRTCKCLLVVLLIGGLTGCQNKKSDTEAASQAEETIIEKDVLNSEVNEETKKLALKDGDLNDSYWRAVYYETFGFGEVEADIIEYDDTYYRYMDVTFSKDKTAKFRSVVGEDYESASGNGQWRITEKGDVILENMTPFEGMRYGYGFIPRFLLVDQTVAPNYEEGMLALEYMDGCVYFRQMEETDPYEGIDLANADRVKQALDESKVNGQDITGEWVLLSGETDGNTWYALESGVECVLYVGDSYATFQYTDSRGYREEYYGMKLIYDNEALYTDLACDYSLYFHPEPSEYEGRYEYVNFGMAPDGEHLIVQMSVTEIGEEYPTKKYYIFQRGFG